MPCETWVYRNVDARVFSCLRRQAVKQGFQIPSSASGKFMMGIAGMNLVFQYQWLAESSVLKLTCIQKPLIIGCAAVKGYADRTIAGCGGRI
ncbi:MAG: hypothetical protein K0R75_2472 [Paenibacillaceae bacterium]|jgi:hypothetical protein|nr:hypothetical protein [Paenibacillaceae bacterium]